MASDDPVIRLLSYGGLPDRLRDDAAHKIMCQEDEIERLREAQADWEEKALAAEAKLDRIRAALNDHVYLDECVLRIQEVLDGD